MNNLLNKKPPRRTADNLQKELEQGIRSWFEDGKGLDKDYLMNSGYMASYLTGYISRFVGVKIK